MKSRIWEFRVEGEPEERLLEVISHVHPVWQPRQFYHIIDQNVVSNTENQAMDPLSITASKVAIVQLSNDLIM